MTIQDDQMNELVAADVNDPSAWGEPVVVGPSNGPRRIRHAKHLELASKFYVLSVLHRLGADATVTFSQSDNVDITVVLESGSALTVDVKTLSGTADWPIGDFRSRAGHFVVFVRYAVSGDPGAPPSVYIIASTELERYVGSRDRKSLSLSQLDDDLHVRDAWQLLAVAPAA